MGLEPVISGLICTHQSTILQTLFVSWNLVIPDNHLLLLSQSGIKNRNDTLKHFVFCSASITLIYLLILKVSCHRSFSLPKQCANKMDNIFDIYILQKLTMIKLLSGTRTCYFPIDMHPPIHYNTDSVSQLKFGYSRQSHIITVSKGHSKR